MNIFKHAHQLSQYVSQQKISGKKIGLVPTMGALHAGHLSLLELARTINDVVVCSIFVNPAQFNNAEDFKFYPVTIEKDIEQLVQAGCDLLFLPPVSEMYPAGYQKKHYALGQIETVLEGHYRPGHFQGVCQAVDRLLEIIQPHRLYLGQKDFQQCIVIRKLVELLNKEDEISITVVPTAREDDGLAMSSRNLRLNPQQRQIAPSLFEELAGIKKKIGEDSIEDLKSFARQHLTQKGFQVDYVEIANANDLSLADLNSKPLVVLAAASIGNVRLIDNLLLN